MEKLYQYIDENRDRFVDELSELLRIPSVTADKNEARKCAALLGSHFSRVGLDIRITETAGNPIVFGRRDGTKGGLTALLYGHYDVMPADDVELWDSPPFEPTVRNGRVYARGAGDDKGQFFAHIKAIEALDACNLPTPELKFIIEGDEEMGSPTLPRFVKEHRELLKADLFYGADGSRHLSNRPTLYLGCRGVLGIELTIREANMDVHSGAFGNVVPNPAWRLAQVLASMRDASGRVLIRGFSDSVVAPTEEERRALARLPFDGSKLADQIGTETLRGMDGAAFHEAIMFRPSLNICGLICGYAGPGPKTIIPSRAAVKMDIRMVVNQDPERMIDAVRSHLDRHGFTDVTMAVQNVMKPSRTPYSDGFVPLTVAAVRAASGDEPIVYPAMGGSLPQYVFADEIGVPCIWSAYANWDQQNHGPNENMDLDCFLQAIKISATVLHRLTIA